METTNIDELMRRHLELAVRSYDAGYLVPAMETAMAALQHEPPSCESPLLQFLIHPALTAIYRDGPAEAELRRYLQTDGEMRKAALWWVRFYLEGSDDDSGAEHFDEPPRQQLAELAEFLAREPAEEDVPPRLTPLPAGCTRCVLVEPSGQARLTRIHVRFGNWGRLDQDPIVGQAVPGAKAALDAARQYLAATGLRRSGLRPTANAGAGPLGLYRGYWDTVGGLPGWRGNACRRDPGQAGRVQRSRLFTPDGAGVSTG
ncbi:MAG: hypothetical protein ACYSWU_15405 [Planctomycetota bacterium]|jgi:hypothetical protein